MVSQEELREEHHPKWYHFNKAATSSKVSYFFQGFKEGSYLPFTNAFLIDVGLSPSRAGIINGVRLVGTVLGSVIWGMTADSTRRHLLILYIVSIVAMGLMVTNVWIPTLIKPTQNIACLNGTTSDILTPNDCQPSSNSALFFTVLALYIAMAFFDGYANVFVDTCVGSQAQCKRKVDIGKQRVFSPLGFAGATLAVSAILDEMPTNLSVSKYCVQHFAYVFGITLLLASSPFLFKRAIIKKRNNESESALLPKIFHTVKRADVILFLCLTVIGGINIGLDECFLLFLLKEMDSPNILFGLTMTVASLSCLVMYPTGSKFEGLIGGPINTMGFAMVCTLIKFGIYKFATSPYLIPVAQILNGFNVGVFNLSALNYTEQISTKDILTSMYGIVNALIFGLGILLANVIGGLMYQHYGVKNLYGCAAVLSGLCAIPVFSFSIYTKKKSSRPKYPKNDEREESHELMGK